MAGRVDDASTTINIAEASASAATDAKGKAAAAAVPVDGAKAAAATVPADGTKAATATVPVDGAKVAAAAPTARVAPFAALRAMSVAKGRWKRGTAVLDFFLRLCTIATSIAAAVTMGTSDETLPFVTQHYQFYANFSDLPTLTFFVVGNAIAGGYLVLSLPFSIVTIVRPHLVGPRMLLLVFDVIMVALTTAAGSSAAAIVYLAHAGNPKANWLPMCEQFDGFCQQISTAVVVSFVGTVLFVVLVVMAALALRRR